MLLTEMLLCTPLSAYMMEAPENLYGKPALTWLERHLNKQRQYIKKTQC